MSDFSKPLGSEDSSGASFVMEMLQGDPTYAINFDRIQWDNVNKRYVIVELLLCDEKQFSRRITPYTSHPNRYWHKNSQKFISLWELARLLCAQLYLVNYSKAGTRYANEVLLMEVLSVNPNSTTHQYVNSKDLKLTRADFSKWFRQLNQRGRRS